MITFRNGITAVKHGHPNDIINIKFTNATVAMYLRNHTIEEFLVEYAQNKNKLGDVVQRYTFECSKMEYNQKTGRVSQITIDTKLNW